MFAFLLINGLFSLVSVQGSSSSADQPEHGAVERGKVPPSSHTRQRSEALAHTGLHEEQPAGFEAAVLGEGRTGDRRPVCGSSAGEEEPSLGPCLRSRTQ